MFCLTRWRATGMAVFTALALSLLWVPARATMVVSWHAGLGPVVSTADGGQIFGWDIDEHGIDGVLTSSQDIAGGNYLTSVETFDQMTGKIVKSVIIRRDQSDFVTDGIFANDVGLVNHEELNGVRKYLVMNPVSGNAFTGVWTPPVNSIEVEEHADNQDTTASVLFAIELRNQDVPDLFVTDVATNTIVKVYSLDPNLFSLGNGPQLAQNTRRNEAVFGLSPDGGRVGGALPLIITINLATGKMKQFNGVNTGSLHSGYVNGIAVDSRTGIACTDTELDAAVEFYDVAKQTGSYITLPGSGGNQFNSGAAIANDPLHRLFLVAQPNSSVGSGSTIFVFKENGALVETINGFHFSNAFSVIPVRIAVNSANRVGFVDGPQINQLQSFRY